MMRKAVSNGNLPGKEGSGRRYWMRAHPMVVKAISGEGPAKRPPKARFLEPYRLSDERRATLIQLLTDGQIGDAESRELFASAIEYDIANARQAGVREAPAVVDEPPMTVPVTTTAESSAPTEATVPLPADLGYAARSLAERITGLDLAVRGAIAEALGGRDPFQRVYGGAYLEALSSELNRLADAVASQPSAPARIQSPVPSAPEPPPQVRLPDPPLGEGARRFLKRVARVYEEVLESRADPGTDGAFRSILGLVAAEAGIPLPRDPARLAAVLQGP